MELNVADVAFQIGLGLISFLANALSAFAGGGAGLVQLPALILLGLPFAMALATHKVASVALGIGAASRHWRERTLNGSITLLMVGCGLPGVWLGARIVLGLPDRWTTTALGVLTLGLGIYSSRRPSLGQKDAELAMTKRRAVLGGSGLFAIGILNGSLTSGTGLFVTLWLVSWFGLSYTRAVAHTLILVGLLWNGTGALVLGIGGDIRWDWLPVLVVGSLVGGYAGAHLSLERGSELVKRGFELLAFTMGVSLLIRSL